MDLVINANLIQCDYGKPEVTEYKSPEEERGQPAEQLSLRNFSPEEERGQPAEQLFLRNFSPLKQRPPARGRL